MQEIKCLWVMCGYLSLFTFYIELLCFSLMPPPQLPGERGFRQRGDMFCKETSSCLYRMFSSLHMLPNSSSLLFCFFVLSPSFQSQGLGLSTPLTLRKPCLHLSACVCVCFISVHAGFEHSASVHTLSLHVNAVWVCVSVCKFCAVLSLSSLVAVPH